MISTNAPRRRRVRLKVERLEDRSIPSTFQGIGTGTPYVVSADGKVVGVMGPTGGQIFRWTNETGMVPLGAATLNTIPFGVSADGSVIVGNKLSSISRAVRISAQGAVEDLGDMNPEANVWTEVHNVSPDGSIVVGYHNGLVGDYNGPFVWTVGGGMAPLAINATVVTNGGTFIGGGGNSLAGDGHLYRLSGAGVEDLSGPTRYWYEAHGMSADGGVLVGERSTAVDNLPAFWWRRGVGVKPLPAPATNPKAQWVGLPGDGSTTGRTIGMAVTADGQTVVGNSTIGPLIWTAAERTRVLHTVLRKKFKLAEEMEGWKLGIVVGMSADGQTIAGKGTDPAGQPRMWVANLRPDIKVLDATTDTALQTISIKYEIAEMKVGPDFKFRAYLSADTEFDADTDTPLAGDLQMTTKKTVGKHSVKLTLDTPVALHRGQFIIVVADADEEVNEEGEDEDTPTGENNALFVIPVFKSGDKGVFDLAGAFHSGVPQDGKIESNFSGPIAGRVSRGTDDFREMMVPMDFWTGPKTFKDEEVNPYRGSGDAADPPDDHWINVDVYARVKSYSDLIDLALDDDRLKGVVTITEAFDENGEHGDGSSHYEGRAIDVVGLGIGKLTGLAMLAGFDWVQFEGNHTHASALGRSATVTANSILNDVTWGSENGLNPVFNAADPTNTTTKLIAQMTGVRDLLAGPPLDEAGKALAKQMVQVFIDTVRTGTNQLRIKQGFRFITRPATEIRPPTYGLLVYNARLLIAQIDLQ